ATSGRRARRSCARPQSGASRSRPHSMSGATSPSTTPRPTRRTSCRPQPPPCEEASTMRITQSCFSFLPDLTDIQITAQVEYILSRDWAVSLEYSYDPHPRNTYWEMWGNPMFDLKDAKGVMMELDACRNAHPEAYIRMQAFDNTR